jgi:hypothetical protein
VVSELSLLLSISGLPDLILVTGRPLLAGALAKSLCCILNSISISLLCVHHSIC